MNSKLILGALAASMIMAGCGSNNDKTTEDDRNTTMDTNVTERFTTMEKMGDTVEQDKTSQLEWVGSAGNGACQPNASAGEEVGAIALAKDHCDALVFAGYDDWRVATASENAEYIEAMKEAGKIPFYGNLGCPRLIGSDGTTAMTVNTHNTDPAGEMTPWSEFLNSNGMKNYGVKCVRNQ